MLIDTPFQQCTCKRSGCLMNERQARMGSIENGQAYLARIVRMNKIMRRWLRKTCCNQDVI